jgi:hypothetical protein
MVVIVIESEACHLEYLNCRKEFQIPCVLCSLITPPHHHYAPPFWKLCMSQSPFKQKWPREVYFWEVMNRILWQPSTMRQSHGEAKIISFKELNLKPAA